MKKYVDITRTFDIACPAFWLLEGLLDGLFFVIVDCHNRRHSRISQP
jgi:hypothetical protein